MTADEHRLVQIAAAAPCQRDARQAISEYLALHQIRNEDLTEARSRSWPTSLPKNRSPSYATASTGGFVALRNHRRKKEDSAPSSFALRRFRAAP